MGFILAYMAFILRKLAEANGLPDNFGDIIQIAHDYAGTYLAQFAYVVEIQ